jgi:hypothetical protein
MVLAFAPALDPSVPSRMARSSRIAPGTWSATYRATPSLATVPKPTAGRPVTPRRRASPSAASVAAATGISLAMSR